MLEFLMLILYEIPPPTATPPKKNTNTNKDHSRKTALTKVYNRSYIGSLTMIDN